jgi:hypothetical protein
MIGPYRDYATAVLDARRTGNPRTVVVERGPNWFEVCTMAEHQADGRPGTVQWESQLDVVR